VERELERKEDKESRRSKSGRRRERISIMRRNEEEALVRKEEQEEEADEEELENEEEEEERRRTHVTSWRRIFESQSMKWYLRKARVQSNAAETDKTCARTSFSRTNIYRTACDNPIIVCIFRKLFYLLKKKIEKIKLK
jgi:hypothetical protein